MKPVHLVMFSAGVDSTFTLYEALQAGDREVIAHHVHFINKEKRYLIESARSRAIVKWLTIRFGPFRYTETAIDHRKMEFFGLDIMSVGFEAGIAAHSYYRSRKKDVDTWTVGTCEEEGHNEKRFKHVLAACLANCYPRKPPKFTLREPLAKLEQMKRMPPDLLDLCWTCRRPVFEGQGQPVECGRCATCKLVMKCRETNVEAKKPVKKGNRGRSGATSPKLGSDRKTITLMPGQQQAWEDAYLEEKDRLERLLADCDVRIEHIGSTAIPGTVSKPIIDIMVGVIDVSQFQKIEIILKTSPYTATTDVKVKKKSLYYVLKSSNQTTHQLAFVPFQGRFWTSRLRFRDALRSDETLVREYNELKRELAAEFNQDLKRYTRGKLKFVESVLIVD